MTHSHAAWLRAVALAICTAALIILGPISAFAQQTRFEGFLSVLWADPKPGVLAGGRTNFTLTLPDGTEHPLEVAPGARNEAIQYFGKRVAVQGRMSTTREASGGPATITADSIEPLEQPQPELTRALTIKKTLFILLRFKGDTQEPHPASFYEKLTNSLNPAPGMLATVNGFFKKTSWGNLQFDADIVGQGGLNPTRWLQLPGARTKYVVPCSPPTGAVCFQAAVLRADALALLPPLGIAIADYDTINFVFNNDLDCCAWGGGFVSGGKFFGTTYQPPWGQEAKVYVHELGHSLGLPHSGWVYYAYDNPWDDMGTNQVVAAAAQCGMYNSALDGPNTPMMCYEPGSGYLASYKDQLGWLPNVNKVKITRLSPSTTTVDLHANALPLGANKKKLIIVCYPGKPCTGPKARFLTIEAKIAVAQFENGLLHDGVIIHDFQKNRPAFPTSTTGTCFFNNQSGWAKTIDKTKNDFNSSTCQYGGGGTLSTAALGNAQFGPGDVYKNNPNGITVRILKAITDGYRVRVTVE